MERLSPGVGLAGGRPFVMSAVPPDLFERMARLDRFCEVQVSSVYSGQRRTGWKVRISRRDTPTTLPLVTFGASLRAALEDAVIQADALGWLDS
jgi:hypothetical protein